METNTVHFSLPFLIGNMLNLFECVVFAPKVIPYKSTSLPLSPLSPSFLIFSVLLFKSIGCQSCLM